MELFTIGHSNHTIEDFISLLQQHSVTALADVRSHPYRDIQGRNSKEVNLLFPLPHSQKPIANVPHKYEKRYIIRCNW